MYSTPAMIFFDGNFYNSVNWSRWCHSVWKRVSGSTNGFSVVYCFLEVPIDSLEYSTLIKKNRQDRPVRHYDIFRHYYITRFWEQNYATDLLRSTTFHLKTPKAQYRCAECHEPCGAVPTIADTSTHIVYIVYIFRTYIYEYRISSFYFWQY